MFEKDTSINSVENGLERGREDGQATRYGTLSIHYIRENEGFSFIKNMGQEKAEPEPERRQ